MSTRVPALALGQHRKIFIGVIHLHPLPGSPRWAGDFDALLKAAVADATANLRFADGVIVGSSLKKPGGMHRPVDELRVPALAKALRSR